MSPWLRPAWRISFIYPQRCFLIAFSISLLKDLHCCQCRHHSDVIISVMASQITRLTIVYLTVYSGADQRKHQSSASLAFVHGIHQWRVNSPHKGPVENASIWWRHHGLAMNRSATLSNLCFFMHIILIVLLNQGISYLEPVILDGIYSFIRESTSLLNWV